MNEERKTPADLKVNPDTPEGFASIVSDFAADYIRPIRAVLLAHAEVWRDDWKVKAMFVNWAKKRATFLWWEEQAAKAFRMGQVEIAEGDMNFAEYAMDEAACYKRVIYEVLVEPLRKPEAAEG